MAIDVAMVSIRNNMATMLRGGEGRGTMYGEYGVSKGVRMEYIGGSK